MRIVVLQPNLLGDVVVMTPMLRQLRRSLPQARIALVLGQKNLAIRPLLGDLVDDVLEYIKRPWPMLKLLGRGRAAGFDWLIDASLAKLKVSQILVRLIGAKQTVGGPDGHSRLYDIVVPGPPGGSMHLSDRYLTLLSPLGIGIPSDPHLELSLPPDVAAWAQQHWPAEPGKPAVLINITGTGAHKFWGVDRYIRLIRAARANHPQLQFVIVGHPRDEDSITQIAQQADVFRAPTTNDFPRFAACMRCADYVITPDTSALHIAVAWGKPVLGFYVQIPPSADTWEPYHSPGVVLKSPTGTVSDISLEQGIDGFECLLAGQFSHPQQPQAAVGSRSLGGVR